MNFKRIATMSTFLALAACVSPTTYKPADADHHTGYSDQRLADNRYRVTFKGNSITRREKVEDYLLLRSAEVTRDAGYRLVRVRHPQHRGQDIVPDGLCRLAGLGTGLRLVLA